MAYFFQMYHALGRLNGRHKKGASGSHTGFLLRLCYFRFYQKNILLGFRFRNTNAVTAGKDGATNILLPKWGIDTVNPHHFFCVLIIYFF